jgi:hypothetical protein
VPFRTTAKVGELLVVATLVVIGGTVIGLPPTVSICAVLDSAISNSLEIPGAGSLGKVEKRVGKLVSVAVIGASQHPGGVAQFILVLVTPKLVP